MAAAPQTRPVERLIVFTRYPRAGTTKTRLIPALGPAGAAALQRRMTERILAVARKTRSQRPLTIEVGFTGADPAVMVRWLGSDLEFQPQAAGDLGQRMATAFKRAFSGAVQRAVLMGSDIPQISPQIIDSAFEGLRQYDLVLGPARDGGYYLIGMTASGGDRLIPAIFENIPWSAAGVYAATRRKAQGLGTNCQVLPCLADVDRPEDLSVWAELPLSGAEQSREAGWGTSRGSIQANDIPADDNGNGDPKRDIPRR